MTLSKLKTLININTDNENAQLIVDCFIDTPKNTLVAFSPENKEVMLRLLAEKKNFNWKALIPTDDKRYFFELFHLVIFKAIEGDLTVHRILMILSKRSELAEYASVMRFLHFYLNADTTRAEKHIQTIYPQNTYYETLYALYADLLVETANPALAHHPAHTDAQKTAIKSNNQQRREVLWKAYHAALNIRSHENLNSGILQRHRIGVMFVYGNKAIQHLPMNITDDELGMMHDSPINARAFLERERQKQKDEKYDNDLEMEFERMKL